MTEHGAHAPCPSCCGSGEAPAYPGEQDCSFCKGTGIDPRPSADAPATWQDIVTGALSARTAGEVGGEPVTVVYTPEGLTVLVENALRSANLIVTEAWWVCTGPRRGGGRRLLGPFGTRGLALGVRTYVERVNAPTTYWVLPEGDDDAPRR